MENNTSSGKSPPATGGLTITSTGVGGGLLGIVSFFPPEWQKLGFIIIPIISPAISWMLLFLFCKFSEPFPIIALRAGLNRDLKELRKILNDKNVSKTAKQQAQKEYDDTILKLANLNKTNPHLDKTINISTGNNNN